MSYSLEDINFRTVADPKAFIEEADEAYREKLRKSADLIIENMDRSPIVLLSGPSGSGKTTTAMKISRELESRGIRTHYIGMDDYFKTVDPKTTPRTPEGDYDLESPLCLNMELLNEHFSMLERGETIVVPKYEFARKMSVFDPARALRPGKDEVFIFEGIHALNDMITDNHPTAFKLYISARSDVEFEGKTVFKASWFRLVRRTVRDNNFRGTVPEETMSMWANVLRGETAYIAPFRHKADYEFDSSLPYELPVMNRRATELFRSVPEGIERFDELRGVLPAIQLFGDIDEELVAPDALIREFIGGGVYQY